MASCELCARLETIAAFVIRLLACSVLLPGPNGALGAMTDRGSEEAVEEIESRGGSVRRDDRMLGKPVVNVLLQGKRFQDSNLAAYTRAFPRLMFLTIDCPNVTDAGLKLMTKSPSLRSLWIRSPIITGSGFENLKSFENLLMLRLSCPQLKNAALKPVAAMKHLTSLDLECPGVSDVGLALLKDSPLFRLHIRKTKLNGKTLASLGEMRNLNDLSILDSTLDETSLVSLSTLRGMTRLALSGSEVTDKMLEQLRMLHNLRHLHLIDTKVSEDAVKSLKTALPRLAVKLTETGQKSGDFVLPPISLGFPAGIPGFPDSGFGFRGHHTQLTDSARIQAFPAPFRDC
jgi:hypothetical protein